MVQVRPELFLIAKYATQAQVNILANLLSSMIAAGLINAYFNSENLESIAEIFKEQGIYIEELHIEANRQATLESYWIQNKIFEDIQLAKPL